MKKPVRDQMGDMIGQRLALFGGFSLRRLERDPAPTAVAAPVSVPAPAPVVEVSPAPAVVEAPATESSTTTTTTEGPGLVERQKTTTYTSPY